MPAVSLASNLDVYNNAEVASHYAGLGYLTPCEQSLFQAHLKQGMTILDLGVGGGRTTGYLSDLASRYVGVDYAATMVEKCRHRFPDLAFLEGDASNLNTFADSSFDAVVMAFNAIDYVLPDSSREACLREVRRVLKPGGRFIFSSHNPRAIWVRPSWNRERVKEFAHNLAGSSDVLFYPLHTAAIAVRTSCAWLSAGAASMVRLLHRFPTRAFWQGDGHLVDSAHGGLLTHYWTPQCAKAELGRHGFEILGTKGDDYPAPDHRYITDWYYYVFQKSN